MKKVITKMLALTALVLFGAGNVNGQTYHAITDGEYIELSQTNIEASDWITYDAANYSSRTKCNEAGATIPNLSKTDRYVTLYISGCESFTIQADGNNSPRYLTYSINDGTAIQTAAWPNNCNEQTFSTENTGDIKLVIAGVNGSVYLSGITFFAPSAPAISSFQVPYGDGEYIAATIDNDANTISAELPYGTDLTSIEPVITLQGTAKSYSPTGKQNFTDPVTYSIYASNDASGEALKTYTVTLTAEQTASTDATLSSITINGTAIEGFDANTTEYSVVLPYSATMPVVDATTTDVAASIAEITQPTSLPATVTITVTAGDGTTTKTYTVNISMETAPKVLKEAVFSNGFNAFIKQSVTNEDGTTDDSQGTVTAYYLGTTAPTVSAENLTCESGSAAIDEDGNIVVTGEDNTTKTFTVSVEAVEPQEASNATITFDGTETWIKNGYGYDSSKGWKFSKNVEEASNRRISEGKTRIYFFVGACKEVTLTTASGITSDRDITVAVNNVNVSSITKAPKNPGSITIPVNSTSPAMIEIKSNKGDGGGDGGFSSISIAPNSTTGLQQVAISSISFNGKQILNPEGLQVSVFDATGRMVINSNNTAISLSQGAYIVKAAQSTLKVIVAE